VALRIAALRRVLTFLERATERGVEPAGKPSSSRVEAALGSAPHSIKNATAFAPVTYMRIKQGGRLDRYADKRMSKEDS
jgi:hypothetical protein